MLELEKIKQLYKRKQNCLVQKFGLRRPQRFNMIQAEPPLLLFDQEGKRRLCSLGAPISPAPFIILTQANRYYSQNNSYPRRLMIPPIFTCQVRNYIKYMIRRANCIFH